MITFKKWCGDTRERRNEWRIYINGLTGKEKRFIYAMEDSESFGICAPAEDHEMILEALEKQFGLNQTNSFEKLLFKVSEIENNERMKKINKLESRTLTPDKPPRIITQPYQSQLAKTR